MTFKPILAATLKDISDIDFNHTWVASPKLDGIRAIVREGAVYSRTLKLIPNKKVQELFGSYEHYDGELIVGPPTAHDVYRQTTSGVMSQDKEPDVKLFAFDHIQRPSEPFHRRIAQLANPNNFTDLVIVEQRAVLNEDDLLSYESELLTLGYEGVMLRRLDASYKFGRSTMREGSLIKVKRFEDAEAQIIGFVEQMHNGNVATRDELGRTKRSSHKANKTGKGTLGALIVRNTAGVEFEIGTGFDDALRHEIWDNRDKYLGKFVKYKFFPVGVKDKPRHPVFLGFRDPMDM